MDKERKFRFLSLSTMYAVLHHTRLPLILLLFCPFFSFPALEKTDSGYLIQNVPFFPQEKNHCGPASLATVLNFWGVKITPEEIAREIYSESAGGTLWIDLTLYARDKGFSAMQYYGSWNDLIDNISAGFPVVVFVDYGISAYHVNHFMVVVGYTKDGVIVHSGTEKEKFEKKRKFMKAWKKTQHWTLLIRPENALFEIKSR